MNPPANNRIAQFEALVGRQPNNELYRFSLAQALIDAGRFREAVPHYEKCVAQKADWMMPRILLGKIYLQLDRPVEARPLLEAALQLAEEQQHEDPADELRALIAGLPPR